MCSESVRSAYGGGGTILNSTTIQAGPQISLQICPSGH